MKLSKIICLFLIFTVLIFSLTGCSTIQTIDDLAYVVAIGLDVGKVSDKLSISFQIAVPSSSGSSSGSEESGSSQSSSSIIDTVECDSIESGVNLVNSYVSKKLNLSHCKVIVISEELAYKGISDYIYTLVNNIEIRPSCNIIVSKCDAKYFLENSKPMLEKLSSRYYEIAPTSSKHTGYTEDVTLENVFSGMTDTFGESYAILGGVNDGTTQAENINAKGDASYTASQTPTTNKSNIENMGLAVFKDAKLVGELNAIETVCHLMVTNNLKSCIISIPSPFSSDKYIDLRVTPSKKSSIKVDFVNNTPYVRTKTYLKARILSMTDDSNYLNEENIKLIEEYANSFLESQISNYLYKTSKQYKSDIAKIGRYAVGKFVTWDDWVKYDWLNNYKNSFFDTDVNLVIKSGYLLMDT